MVLRRISYELDMIGDKDPGEEVWFILNGELVLRVKVWFPSWSAQMQIYRIHAQLSDE